MSCAADYDVQFASRFSAEDAEFQRYRQRAPDAPPVLEDWRAARGRRDRRVPEPRRYDRNYGSYGQRSRDRISTVWCVCLSISFLGGIIFAFV